MKKYIITINDATKLKFIKELLEDFGLIEISDGEFSDKKNGINPTPTKKVVPKQRAKKILSEKKT